MNTVISKHSNLILYENKQHSMVNFSFPSFPRRKSLFMIIVFLFRTSRNWKKYYLYQHVDRIEFE